MDARHGAGGGAVTYDIKARNVVRYYVNGKGYASLLHLCRALAKRELQDLVFGKDWERLDQARDVVRPQLYNELGELKPGVDPYDARAIEREVVIDLYMDFFSAGPRSQCPSCAHIGNAFTDRCWHCRRAHWITTRAQEIAATFTKQKEDQR